MHNDIKDGIMITLTSTPKEVSVETAKSYKATICITDDNHTALWPYFCRVNTRINNRFLLQSSGICQYQMYCSDTPQVLNFFSKIVPVGVCFIIHDIQIKMLLNLNVFPVAIYKRYCLHQINFLNYLNWWFDVEWCTYF